MKDLLIIGAGPIGLSCGIEAQKANLDYVIIDKGTLVNSLFNYPIFMQFFSTAERLGIGDIPFMCVAPKPGRQEALEYYRAVTHHYKLNVRLFETVENVEKKGEHHFVVTTSKEIIEAKNIVVATGFYDIPMLLNIKGEDLPKVRHYYKEPHEFAFQNVVVVGSSNSSVDAALETWHLNANVTMVIRKEEIGPRVKYWVRPNIENRIKEGSIKAHYNSELVEIREGEVDIQTPEGIITIPNDFVLALTGYRPNFDFLRNCGIELAGPRLNPVHSEETMETNIAGIYLAGVVCGGLDTHLWFIENSQEHSKRIVSHIISSQQ